MSAAGHFVLQRAIRETRAPIRHRMVGTVAMIGLVALCALAAVVIGSCVDHLGNFLLGITQ